MFQFALETLGKEEKRWLCLRVQNVCVFGKEVVGPAPLSQHVHVCLNAVKWDTHTCVCASAEVCMK